MEVLLPLVGALLELRKLNVDFEPYRGSGLRLSYMVRPCSASCQIDSDAFDVRNARYVRLVSVTALRKRRVRSLSPLYERR